MIGNHHNRFPILEIKRRKKYARTHPSKLTGNGRLEEADATFRTGIGKIKNENFRKKVAIKLSYAAGFQYPFHISFMWK